MIECPHSIYFFRNSVENFEFFKRFRGNKTAEELTAVPNPLLIIDNLGYFFRASQSFMTTNCYVEGAGVQVKIGTYLKVVRTEVSAGVYEFKFDLFGDNIVNTLLDWHIVPLGRPVVAPPQQKLHTIEVPGASGIIDLSNSLTKYPVFSNRVGNFNFAILADETDTPTAFTKMMRFLQGTDVKMILEDDPLYYYEGRVYVESIDPKADGTCSEVSIGYDLYPYRKSIHTSVDDWLWDSFNFETDAIISTIFTNMVINSNNYGMSPDDWQVFDFEGLVDMMPFNPEFVVDCTDYNLIENPTGNPKSQGWYEAIWNQGHTDITDFYPTSDTSVVAKKDYFLKGNSPIQAELLNSDLDIFWKPWTLTNSTEPYSRYGLTFCQFTEESELKMRFKGQGKIQIRFRSGRL